MPDLNRVLKKAIRERDLSTIRRMLEKQSRQLAHRTFLGEMLTATALFL